MYLLIAAIAFVAGMFTGIVLSAKAIVDARHGRLQSYKNGWAAAADTIKLIETDLGSDPNRK